MRCVIAYSPLFLLFGAALPSCQRTDVRPHQQVIEKPKIAIGRVAPEIEGVDQDGVSFRLSDYRGKVVVLNFWAHW